MDVGSFPKRMEREGMPTSSLQGCTCSVSRKDYLKVRRTTMINISLNNEPKQIASDTLLSDALTQWGFGEIKIAVAINSEFVPRSAYTDRQLQDGDQIDIVKPVGGG